jgi:hypothetical protein
MSIDIIGIDTIPELDPYRRHTGTPTKTVLVLDPMAGTITVEQRPDPSAAGTSMVEWHGRVKTLSILGHPSEDDLRQSILEAMPLFERVVGGYSEGWDTQVSNRVGMLTEDAREAWEELEQALNYEGRQDGWSLWSCWDWMQDYPMAEILAERIRAGEEIDAGLEAKALEVKACADNIVLYEAIEYVERMIDSAKVALAVAKLDVGDEDELAEAQGGMP